MVEGHPDCTGVDGRAFESTGRSDRTDELSRFIVEHDRRHPGMATAAPRSRPALALVRRRARLGLIVPRTVVGGGPTARSRANFVSSFEEDSIRFRGGRSVFAIRSCRVLSDTDASI